MDIMLDVEQHVYIRMIGNAGTQSSIVVEQVIHDEIQIRRRSGTLHAILLVW